jgi:hypothetical protein
MQLVLSNKAIVEYFKREYKQLGCLTFEGTTPQSLNDLPFDPANLESAIASSVGSFYTEDVIVIENSANSETLLSYNIEEVPKSQYVSFQYIPRDLLPMREEGTVCAFAKVYVGEDDWRPFGNVIAKQHINTLLPVAGGNGGGLVWYLSDYSWTYFEFAKPISIDFLEMTRSRYNGTTKLCLQYYNESTGMWEDITGRGIDESTANLPWSGSPDNEMYKLTYVGGYQYHMEFKNPVTTQKLRIRSAEVENPTQANAETFRTMYNFSVTTKTDMTDIERDVTPTWGIAYGWDGTNKRDPSLPYGNPFFIFEIGANGDLVTNQATFNPRDVDLFDVSSSPMQISTKQLT